MLFVTDICCTEISGHTNRSAVVNVLSPQELIGSSRDFIVITVVQLSAATLFKKVCVNTTACGCLQQADFNAESFCRAREIYILVYIKKISDSTINRNSGAFQVGGT